MAREYYLFICNRHDSHITTKFITYYIDDKILLIILLLHILDLTQPLNVDVFNTLKKKIVVEIYPLI